MSALIQADIEEVRTSGPVNSIAIEFGDDGFLLRQVHRGERAAIYEKFKGGQPRGFEVVILRIRAAEALFGRHYPERERYPSSEEWGTYGWSCMASDLKGAQRRLEELARMPVAVGGIGEKCDSEICPLS